MVTNNDTVIRAVTVFAEGVFEGESVVAHPFEVRHSVLFACVPAMRIASIVKHRLGVGKGGKEKGGGVVIATVLFVALTSARRLSFGWFGK